MGDVVLDLLLKKRNALDLEREDYDTLVGQVKDAIKYGDATVLADEDLVAYRDKAVQILTTNRDALEVVPEAASAEIIETEYLEAEQEAVEAIKEASAALEDVPPASKPERIPVAKPASDCLGPHALKAASEEAIDTLSDSQRRAMTTTAVTLELTDEDWNSFTTTDLIAVANLLIQRNEFGFYNEDTVAELQAEIKTIRDKLEQGNTLTSDTFSKSMRPLATECLTIKKVDLAKRYKAHRIDYSRFQFFECSREEARPDDYEPWDIEKVFVKKPELLDKLEQVAKTVAIVQTCGSAQVLRITGEQATPFATVGPDEFKSIIGGRMTLQLPCTVRPETMSRRDAYREWPDHIHLRGFGFRSDVPPLCIYKRHNTHKNMDELVFNRFGGFGVNVLTEEPDREVRKQLDHMYEFWHDDVCRGNVELYEYLLNFHAFVTQKPEVKFTSFPLFVGDQGTGKSISTDPIRTIIGPKHSLLTNKSDAVFGRFNDHLVDKTLCIMNEFTFDVKRGDLNALKCLTTDSVISVETKGAPVYQIDNYTHYIFCTNDYKSIPIEPGDRRVGTIDFQKVLIDHPGLYERISWMHDKSGHNHIRLCEAFLYDLLRRDISQVNPAASPPLTEAKSDEKVAGLTSAKELHRKYLIESCQRGYLIGFSGWPANIPNKDLKRKLTDYYIKHGYESEDLKFNSIMREWVRDFGFEEGPNNTGRSKNTPDRSNLIGKLEKVVKLQSGYIEENSD